MDLGHLLARWDEAGEEPTMLGSADNPDRAGLPTRAEMAERYASAPGSISPTSATTRCSRCSSWAASWRATTPTP